MGMSLLTDAESQHVSLVVARDVERCLDGVETSIANASETPFDDWTDGLIETANFALVEADRSLAILEQIRPGMVMDLRDRAAALVLRLDELRRRRQAPVVAAREDAKRRLSG